MARIRSSYLGALALILTGARLAAYGAGLDHDPWFYRFFPFELPLFVLGMLSFRLFNRIELLPFSQSRPLALVAIAGLVMLAQLFVLNVPVQYSFVGATMAAAVVPIAFAAFKDASVDRFVGDLSYPIYLLHFPIIQFLSDNYAVVVATSLLLSCLIVVGVERPLERLRHHLTDGRTKNQPMPAITTKATFKLANTADQNPDRSRSSKLDFV